MERRWSGSAPHPADARIPRHRRHGPRRDCARPRTPRRARRRATPPPNTPSPSRASAPGRCSSTMRMTWAREPTRSRWPRHPSLDRPTSRPRHRSFRPTRAPAHQQPLDLVTAPTRGHLCANVGPDLRRHRRRSHAGAAGHSPNASKTRARTRPLAARRRAPRARAPRPGLHRRRLRSRPAVTGRGEPCGSRPSSSVAPS